MAVLDEESGKKVEEQSEGTKTSSLTTIRRREDDAEVGKETGIIATSRPRVGDSATEDGGGSELKGDDASDDDGLPMSRARCIALVATVTGAAFLNVSHSSQLHLIHDINPNMYITTDPLRAKRRHHPPHHRPPPLRARKPATVDCLVVLARLWLLPALLGPHRRPVRQAARLHPGIGVGDGHNGGEPVCAE